MLGDLRVLDLGDELLLDTERVALQELFNMIRRYKLGRDVELHKRTLERGLLSLDRAGGARGRPGAEALPGPSTPTPRGDRRRAGAARRDRRRGRPDLRRRAHRRPQGALATCPRSPRRRRRWSAWRPGARATGSTSTIRDPAGGGPQRARRLLHQGLLRRSGDRRAPLLPRQAEPPPARPAAVRARATGDALRLGEREVGRVGSSVVSPARGPIGLAIVRREAAPGDTDAAPRQRRRRPTWSSSPSPGKVTA